MFNYLRFAPSMKPSNHTDNYSNVTARSRAVKDFFLLSYPRFLPGALGSRCCRPKARGQGSRAISDIQPRRGVWKTSSPRVSEGSASIVPSGFTHRHSCPAGKVEGISRRPVLARPSPPGGLFRAAEKRGIPLVSAAPVGFGTNMLVFKPGGMPFEKYFDFAHQ